jgi:hypothetical protein
MPVTAFLAWLLAIALAVTIDAAVLGLSSLAGLIAPVLIWGALLCLPVFLIEALGLLAWAAPFAIGRLGRWCAGLGQSPPDPTETGPLGQQQSWQFRNHA